ncbi:MAG: stage III sporulation protein AE [Eubacterium sp.]|jgi:stage III sporulation protein AE|nr:stage III sporulation protein AE [Eubacterium sp.]
MKSFVIFLLLLLIMTALLYIPVFAEESPKDDYGKEELIEALPNDVGETLGKYNVEPDNGGVLDFSAGDFFSHAWDVFLIEIKRPLTMLFSLVGVILLYAAAEAVRDSTGSGKAGEAFSVVAVTTGAVMISVHISECVLSISKVLGSAGTFFSTFIPIFAGLMAITGQLATAGVFGTAMMIAAGFFAQLITAVLTPLTGCVLGISLAGAVDPGLNIERIAELIKKIVVWGLGFITAVFAGMLSVQSLLTSSADSVTMKAAKFVVSGGVPIIGGAVGDALSTVNASVGIIKASTGTFGIIAGLFILLPAFGSVVCYRLSLAVAAGISDLFGMIRLSSLIKSGESVMKIISALIICFALLMLVSIALMLIIGKGS